MYGTQEFKITAPKGCFPWAWVLKICFKVAKSLSTKNFWSRFFFYKTLWTRTNQKTDK